MPAAGHLKLGAKAFNFALDKTWDHLPDHIFQTPAERKRAKEKTREKAQDVSDKIHEVEGAVTGAAGGAWSGAHSGAHAGAHQQRSPERDPQQQYRRSGSVPNEYSSERNYSTSQDSGFGSRNSYDQNAQGSQYGYKTDGAGGPAHPMAAQPQYQPNQDRRRSYDPRNYTPAAYLPQEDNAHDEGYASQTTYNGRPSRQSTQFDDSATGDSYDTRTSSRQSRRQSRPRTPNRSRSRSKSQDRTKTHEFLHKRFDSSDKGLATGAIGAIAGGFIGHKVGHNHPLATAAGALIGGLGANAVEAKHEQKNRELRRMRREHGRRASSVGVNDRHGSRPPSYRRRDTQDRSNDYSSGGDYYGQALGRSRSVRSPSQSYWGDDYDNDGGSGMRSRSVSQQVPDGGYQGYDRSYANWERSNGRRGTVGTREERNAERQKEAEAYSWTNLVAS